MPIETPYTDATLCELLWANAIAFTRGDHPAVFTCDEADRLVPAELVGVQTKNLFLRDGKGRRHWLLVTSCEKAVDLKALAPRIGADNLSLGSPERLLKFLGLTPGAVSLFGLANDPTHDVVLLVDRDVWERDAWRCHPMVNTATLVINRDGVDRFLALTGHQATPVVVPVRVA
ncbi:MAG: prolyl-tRNA synthetase associated domain-containing protein [Gemmatimonadetes bacterium]|mgnify:FL=1|jgi:Ala-tRNA(Pro) deacylase|nr:prolyl-tRNA synthetase associated domain-containing protein [Gemmatimonadota bacterium]HNV77771.1 prolyl-tRNA synthetase associated domain-containing protein [Gemmatimonadaceae bacterium]MBK6844773.1 prolyl-tRNA synthetase associated domain-containing protein [Gemmatimonadota bacterium]MBK8057069.1 prolyl-tRNA synthetase associated domain-containing protein [Gemmatimonadota bacterium]MBK8649167.1 prolyl-tRNA synthetase associated domain-containing protein [Gemmatimonadota bacterium]